jgi:hypothetical protein
MACGGPQDPCRTQASAMATVAGERRQCVTVTIAAGYDRCTETQARTHGMLAPLDTSTPLPAMVANEK